MNERQCRAILDNRVIENPAVDLLEEHGFLEEAATFQCYLDAPFCPILEVDSEVRIKGARFRLTGFRTVMSSQREIVVSITAERIT